MPPAGPPRRAIRSCTTRSPQLRDKTDAAGRSSAASATRISVLLAAEALRDVPTATSTVETPLGPARGAPHRARTSSSCRCCGRASACSTPCSSSCRRRASATSACSATRLTAVASQVLLEAAAGLGEQLRADDRPDARDRRQRRRRRSTCSGTSGASRIRIVCIVAAPEGVAVVEREHPDVSIYTPVVDSHLNAQKYIVPGLGDFGDRLYGTLYGTAREERRRSRSSDAQPRPTSAGRRR